MATKKSLKTSNSSEEISFPVAWGVIQAKAWGPDDGQPFLGLHGLQDNANTFVKLVPFLPANCRFVAIDLPGHGKSSHRWRGMPYMVSLFVVDVKNVMTQLGWKKCSIIGHSLGGIIASMYAGTFPNEVENLVLIDFALPRWFNLFVKEPAKLLARYAISMSSQDTKGNRVYPNIASAVERRRRVSDGSTLSEEDAGILVERGTKITEAGVVFSHDQGVAFNFPLVFRGAFLKLILCNINCSVLILEGKESKAILLSKETVEEFLGVIREHARFSIRREVPGGHYLHLECPKRTGDEINDFLSSSQSSSNHECVPRSKI